MEAQTLDRTRTAMKFSLWAWACYWPAMGAMLFFAGMTDPASVGVVALSVTAFVLLLASGALRATSSRNVRELLLERPLYLIAALAVFLTLGSTFSFMANVGLVLFSGAYLGGLLLVGYRLVVHVDATGKGVFRSGADQVFVLLLITVVPAFMVFVDAFKGAGVGNSSITVAVANWVSLAYPALLLIASRPLREPLRLVGFGKAKQAESQPGPAAVAPE